MKAGFQKGCVVIFSDFDEDSDSGGEWDSRWGQEKHIMEEEHEGGQEVTSWRERKQNNRMVSRFCQVWIKESKIQGVYSCIKKCEDIFFLCILCVYFAELLDYKSSDSLWNVAVNIRLQA